MTRCFQFSRYRPLYLAVVGYGIGTVVLTFPLLFRLSSGTQGLPLGDPGQSFWNIWWLGKALADPGLSVFRTNYLYYPLGAGLAYHNFHPLLSLGVLGLSPLFGKVVAYNLVLLMGPFLSAVGMYLCAREWGAPARAAWLAGFLFLFAPFRAEIWVHWETQSTQWIPFYLLFLRRAVLHGGAGSILGCSLSLIFTALTSWYHLVALLAVSCVLAPALVFFPREKGQNRRRLLRLLAAAVLTLILFSPYLRILVQQRSSRGRVFSFEAVHHWSSDVLNYVLPVPLQKAVSPHLRRSYYRFSAGGGHRVYPGTAVWILLFASLFLVRRNLRSWPLLASAMLLLVLSLGPALKCGTLVEFPKTDVAVPLPGYPLFRNVPLLNSIRAVCYLGIGVTPLLALFAAVNWEKLVARLPHWTARRERILITTLCVLGVVEGWCAPLKTHQVEVPFIYRIIASQRESASVIESPCTAIEDLARSMYFQTVHEQPLVGGYLARPSPGFEELASKSPIITFLRRPDSALDYHFPQQLRNSLRDDARTLNLGYIVIHDDRLSASEREGVMKLFEGPLPCTLIASDGLHHLYQLPLSE
jgi:hypothetical protein